MSICEDDIQNTEEGMIIGKYLLKFEKEDNLDEVWIDRAKNLLGETPDVKTQAIEEFKQMIRDEPHLKFPIENEIFILCFLRICRFNVTKAFKFVQRYFTYRATHKKVFQNLLPSNSGESFKQNIIQILPLRDQQGRRIIVHSFGKNWKPSTCSAFEIFRASVLLVQLASFEPKTQISGSTVITNLDGFSLNHITALSPSLAKLLVNFIQDCLPTHLNAVHIINQPKIFNIAFAIFKPFINERLRHKIHFHGPINGPGRESLLRFISGSHLPIWLGGELDIPKKTGPKLHEFINKYEELFEESSSWGYNLEV